MRGSHDLFKQFPSGVLLCGVGEGCAGNAPLPAAGSAEPQKTSQISSVETHSSSIHSNSGSSLVSSIVGRDEEQERLRTCQDLVAAAQRQIVFVTGEAGIGKTALVDAFLRQDAPRFADMLREGSASKG